MVSPSFAQQIILFDSSCFVFVEDLMHGRADECNRMQAELDICMIRVCHCTEASTKLNNLKASTNQIFLLITVLDTGLSLI